MAINTAALSGMSSEQLIALITTMAAQPARKLSFKVTAKKPDGKGTDGALSIYGLGQFPTTLYASQWERILDCADDIRMFIKINDKLLVRKS